MAKTGVSIIYTKKYKKYNFPREISKILNQVDRFECFLGVRCPNRWRYIKTMYGNIVDLDNIYKKVRDSICLTLKVSSQ